MLKVGTRVQTLIGLDHYVGTIIDVLPYTTYPYRVRWDDTGKVGACAEDYLRVINGLQLAIIKAKA